MDDLVTLAEAAAQIPGATAETLKRKARAGKLQVYKVGRHYLTTRADLQKMIEASRVVPTNPAPRPYISDPELSRLALDQAMAALHEKAEREKAERRRLKKEERERWAREDRLARAREKHQEQKRAQSETKED